LLDAAGTGDAFSPNQIVTILRPMTKMVEDKTMIDFPDISAETGEPISSRYGNPFKSGVVRGIGAASATGGLAPGQNGQVDVVPQLMNFTPAAACGTNLLIVKAVTMEYFELMPQIVFAAGVCSFLCYRDRLHDDRLTTRIEKLEDGLANCDCVVQQCTNFIPATCQTQDAGSRTPAAG
jgi:hypothetical protein